MLGKALAILAADIAIVASVAVHVRGEDLDMSNGLLWGLGCGTIAALSAIGGAFWAESKRLPMNRALAIVVVGMLFRMFFLAAAMLVAIELIQVTPIAFVFGFGAVYVAGQALEVWMLTRLRAQRSRV